MKVFSVDVNNHKNKIFLYLSSKNISNIYKNTNLSRFFSQNLFLNISKKHSYSETNNFYKFKTLDFSQRNVIFHKKIYSEDIKEKSGSNKKSNETTETSSQNINQEAVKETIIENPENENIIQTKSNECLDILQKVTEDIKHSNEKILFIEENYQRIVHKFLSLAKDYVLRDDNNDNNKKQKNSYIEDFEAFNFPKNLINLKGLFGEENYEYFIFILENMKLLDLNNLKDILITFDYYNLSIEDVLKLNSLLINLYIKDISNPLPISFIIMDYLGNKRNRKIVNSEYFKKFLEIIKNEDELTIEKMGNLQFYSNFLNSFSNYQIVDKELNEILINFYKNNNEFFDDKVNYYFFLIEKNLIF